MTIMNARREHRVILRTHDSSFWETVQKYYAGTDAEHWKPLAMLALRINAGWSVDQIALAFGHAPGHVSRCLQQIKCELRSRFQPPPGTPGWDASDDCDAPHEN
jgi:hypothetical protein